MAAGCVCTQGQAPEVRSELAMGRRDPGNECTAQSWAGAPRAAYGAAKLKAAVLVCYRPLAAVTLALAARGFSRRCLPIYNVTFYAQLPQERPGRIALRAFLPARVEGKLTAEARVGRVPPGRELVERGLPVSVGVHLSKFDV